MHPSPFLHKANHPMITLKLLGILCANLLIDLLGIPVIQSPYYFS